VSLFINIPTAGDDIFYDININTKQDTKCINNKGPQKKKLKKLKKLRIADGALL